MKPLEPSVSTSQVRAEEVLAEFMQRQDRGEAVSGAQLLSDHPDLAVELHSYFEDCEDLEPWMGRACHGSKQDPVRTPVPVPADPAGGESGCAGRIIGDYELLEELARGGMGIVYKARQQSLQRLVALKMIRSGQLASPLDVQRFHTEAEAAAHLDHPHIVPIHEVGEHAGEHYFSMKLIEGGSLAEKLPDFRLPLLKPRTAKDARGVVWSARQLSERKAKLVQLLATVARAVHYAHQRGILHRDLKPANILLDGQGQPHLTDFGLARRVQADASLFPSGAVVGTPSYMAPEQAAPRRGPAGTGSGL